MKYGIYNNKGGVGKSTTVINLAYLFAKMGKEIQVVDCDTQRNSFEFFAEKEYENISVTMWENYSESTAETVIFDLPPKMDEETREILNQCDYIFVPMELSKFSVTGLKNVQQEVANSKAKFGGAFICKYDRRSAGVNEMLRYAQENIGEYLMHTIIPSSFAIGNSINYDLTATEYMNNSSTIKLADLAEEILERTGGR
jgi:chromosome partitioning protein